MSRAEGPSTGRERLRMRVDVRGAVQGIGFRPFVYRLASELALGGWVENSLQGATVEVEGPGAAIGEFLRRLESEKPPLARYADLVTVPRPAAIAGGGFTIRASAGTGRPSALVMPDIAPCDACRAEVLDPRGRRYRYPFTSCASCGPRYSILERLPYDRPNTSMRRFPLCAGCLAEYADPHDRRFHAQPLACPACGPQLAAWDASGCLTAERADALAGAAALIRRGGIVAWKGVGGFLLSCDALDQVAVERLRARKFRSEKPFAILMPSLDEVRRHAAVSEAEARLLTSPATPIVLLGKRPDAGLCPAVSPGLRTLGVMLPSSPLHHLLVAEVGGPVVATSGNLAEEPLCTDEREALARLGGIADMFLVHDRPIVRPVDDSVARIVLGRPLLLRRARGFAPVPVVLPRDGPPVIAFGGHAKNTVAVAFGQTAFVSPHIGDLDSPRALDVMQSTVRSLSELYGRVPVAVACDAHPDYASTREAEQQASKLGVRVVAVQHHHAHVLACAADNGLSGPLFGVAWDGAGLGPDGTVWGGELLYVDGARFERVAHLRTFPLPGGDRAAREPRRAALGVLFDLLGEDVFTTATDLPPLAAFTGAELRSLRAALNARVNCPRTSSAGRLFDAVAALAGVRQLCSFEGQAAIELEQAIPDGDSPNDDTYPLPARDAVLDWEPLVRAVIADRRAGAPPGLIAGRFHAALAEGIAAVAARAGLPRVVLAGGCFQNRVLLEWTVARLRARGLDPYWPVDLPPNDGALALGQVAAVTFAFGGA